MIVAPQGYYLLSVDYSQAESWVVAYSAGEKKMKRELAAGHFHEATAIAIYNLPLEATEGFGMLKQQRYIGKKSNHANSYRQGYLMYVTQVNKEGNITISNAEGKRHHTIWHETYHVKEWWADIEMQLQNNHFLVTPYGRKRYFYGVLGNETYKEATAFIPQSTVADHLFGKVQKELGIEGGLITVYNKIIKNHENEIRIINTAHDSAIFEVSTGISSKEISSEIVSILKRPLVVNGESFVIPMDCEVGERWGELEKLKVN
jgi:DNA polymerase I-like protein with 3'-5' exonuclease and polymerase domains